MLDFLRSPAAHAAGVSGLPQVEAIETHMSWVFLVGDRVLKLKKAVRYPFLDFSTLAAREACCREELRLNQRLAPGVYRGLVALLRSGGRFALVPESELVDHGAVCEWLVWMNRLPRGRMLDQLIAGQQVQTSEVDALAGVLAGFYRDTARPAPDPAGFIERLGREQALNRTMLLHPRFALESAPDVLDRMDQALLHHRAALCRRAADGRIVDGHGDLRPEHVCLLKPPMVIDCLEFNAALRQVDPFDELAFLAMECAMAGAAWIGPRLLAGCARALADTPPAAVWQVYTAGRALLRARLALAHLLDDRPRTPERWAPQARRYLAQAAAALAALARDDAALSATRRLGWP